jgi:pantothenate kinase type III
VRTAPGLACIISGGAARALAPRLTIPFDLHENIVLEGLYRISQTLPPAVRA